MLRDVAVDRHAAGGDQLLGLAARGDAGARERALDAHRLVSCERSYPAVVRRARGARSAIASSSARGSSSRWRSAKCSRKTGVVP